MAGISSEVDTVMTNASAKIRLGFFCEELNKTKTTSRSDPYVRSVEEGMRLIAQAIAEGAHKIEPRFQGRIVTSGSFYEDLKVGDPDEFDYTLLLSSPRVCHFEATDEAGFVNVLLDDTLERRTWMDCLSVFCPKHGVVIEDGFCKFSKTKHRVTVSDNRVLDPQKVQKAFRELTDKVVNGISLPPNWEHGGANRPTFSGHRKHGPATMFQFIHRTTDTELKVNIDITLGIEVPFQIRGNAIRFPVLEESAKTSIWAYRMLQNNVPLYVIPLYSKMMLSRKKYYRKHTWRISASPLENDIFQAFGADSLESRAVRILKILRDTHLTYHKRKTKRQKKRRKRHNRSKSANRGRSLPASGDESSSSYLPSECGECSDGCTSEPNSLSDRKSSTSSYEPALKREASQVQDHAVDGRGASSRASTQARHTSEVQDTAETHAGCISTVREAETTDLTDVELTTARLSRFELNENIKVFQAKDIGLVEKPPGPGSGEYWGPRQYIGSIEIKMWMLWYVIKHGRTQEPLCDVIVKALLDFQVMAKNNKHITSIYVGGPVCTPQGHGRAR